MHRRLTTLIGCLLGWGLFLMSPLTAAEPARPPKVWKQKQDFAATLQAPGSGTWKQVALREVITDLADVHRIFLLLDRRIDPDQQFDYTPPHGSLEVTLRGIAAHLKLGIAIGDGWVYFGPPDAAKKLRTLIALREAEAEAIYPRTQLAAWTRRAPLAWTKAQAPRELVADQLDKFVKIVNPETIVPDLWAAANWPPLTLCERLALCLIQFDLTWQWQDEGQTLKFVPLPAEVSITKQYTVADPAPFVAKLKEFQITKLEVTGKVVKLTGSAEEQQIAADLAAGKQARKVAVKQDTQRFTLTANNPVKNILREVARSQGLTLEIDEAALQKEGQPLDRQIKLEVREVTREELLTKVLEGSGLAYEIKDQKLIIKPAK
jgi:hypothetical protein